MIQEDAFCNWLLTYHFECFSLVRDGDEASNSRICFVNMRLCTNPEMAKTRSWRVNCSVADAADREESGEARAPRP